MKALWFVLTLAHTVVTVLQWRLWLDYKSMEMEYSPEVLAAAEFRIPPSLLGTAVTMTVLAAFMWWRVWHRAGGLLWLVLVWVGVAWLGGALCGERIAEARIDSIVKRELDKRLAPIEAEIARERKVLAALMGRKD